MNRILVGVHAGLPDVPKKHEGRKMQAEANQVVEMTPVNEVMALQRLIEHACLMCQDADLREPAEHLNRALHELKRIIGQDG